MLQDKKIRRKIIKFKFIDSYKFINSSLEKLASYLKEFNILKSQFPSLNNEVIALLCKKGIFPYSYVDSWEVLQENSLPKIEEFNNLLLGKPISQEEFLHAQNVWNVFNIKTLGEYSDLYLKTDVLLLAEVIF